VPLTSPQFYSAGTTLDLALSLHYLRTTFPDSPLHGIGFSLGASVLARYLGESSSQCLLSSGIVLGAPWDLPRMSIKLETHWFISRVYSKAMASNLVKLVFRHYDKNPELFDAPGSATAEWMPILKKMRYRSNRLKEVDQYMVSRFGGPQGIGLWPFEDGADGYYKWASPDSTIATVQR
jgi:predicted alpha/beta-fold hydrolase